MNRTRVLLAMAWLLAAAACSSPRPGEPGKADGPGGVDTGAGPPSPPADAAVAAETGGPDLPPDLPPAPIPQGQQRLTVTVRGPGHIDIAPLNARCESSCRYDVPTGTMLMLSATPTQGPVEGGTRFLGWTDACTGVAACAVTLDVSRMVAADFHRLIAWEQGAPPISEMRLRGDELYLAGAFPPSDGKFAQNLISRGRSDGFVARFGIDGGLQWLKTLGGPMEDDFWTMSLPQQGQDILLAGTAGSDGVEYDGRPFGVTGSFRVVVTSAGELKSAVASPLVREMATDRTGNLLAREDVGDVPAALVKRDPSGRELWSKPGAYAVGFHKGPYLDATGDVVAMHIMMAPVTIAGTNFTTDNGHAVVVKLSPAGEYRWAVQYGAGPGAIHTITLDDAGNVYLSFSFEKWVRLAGRYEMSMSGGTDVGFAKLSAAKGELLWFRTFATPMPDTVGAFAFDGRGFLMAMASFPAPITVGSRMFPRGDLAIRLSPETGDALWAMDAGRPIGQLFRHVSGDFFYVRDEALTRFIGRLSLP